MNAVRDMLEKEGHRSTFIDTTVAYIESLHNILAVCQLRLLSTSEFPERSADADRFPLDGVQLGIVNAVIKALEGRDRYYDSQCAFIYSDEENGDEYVDQQVPSAHSNCKTSDWTHPILVTGSSGTGKTQTVFAAIERCIAEEREALLYGVRAGTKFGFHVVASN